MSKCSSQGSRTLPRSLSQPWVIGKMNLLRSFTVKVPVDTPENFLKLTKKCKEQAQRMTTPNLFKHSTKMINPEQCKHLADKLKLAADSAQTFLGLFMSSESHSKDDRENCLIVFKLLYALANVAESFIRACSQDAWIQAALLMTNVLEHTLAVSFDLEVLTRLFNGKLKLTKVDLIYKAESASVKAKAAKDTETLVLGVNELLQTRDRTTREYHLAALVLDRLLNRRQKQASTSSLSGSYQISLESLKQMELIGRGGYATVHRALWLGIEVAKKTPLNSLRSDPAFAKEVAILGGLSHPNITSLLCYAEDEQESCMVMELMEEDLFGLIRRRMKERARSPGPFNMWESVDIMHQIGRGMQYLHDVRIVHRDLKSKNILVRCVKGREADIKTEYVLAKVTDFGLSKEKERSVTFGDETPNTGTPRWMAPELIKFYDGKEAQKASPVAPKYPFLSDVYSYAMVCYEILTGQEPYFDMLEEGFRVLKEKILRGVRPELPSRCPPSLKNLLERCWNEDASKRPRFVEICAELQYLKCSLLLPVAQQVFPKGSLSSSAVTTGFKRVRDAEPQLLKYDTSKEEAQIKPSLNRSITVRVSDRPDRSRPIQWVISLDFGTTYSGFAYAKVSTANQPTKIRVFNDWPRKGNETPYCKTLTASYYNPVGPSRLDFGSWGYPAQTDFLSHKGSPYGVRARPYLISNFKLLLNQEYVNNPEKLSISIPAPLTMTAIITEYLKQVGDHALSVVRSHHDEGLEFSKELVQWCVTVPSVWDENAKQQMKACMVNTGLVSGAAAGGNDTVKVVLEAEAASFHCIQNLRQERKDVLLNVKDKVLVADVGGGIVDIVVQELSETADRVYQMKELTESSGGLCGGTFVDESFMRFISKKIECLEEFLRTDFPSYRTNLLRDWEHHKRSFGHESLANTNLAITLHPKLASKWEEYERKRRGVQPRENFAEIELSQRDMESIFDPVVDEILELIAAQLTQVPDVKVIFVVGGFAGSPYLIRRIRARFNVQHIVCPPNPGAAVCQGAVSLARMPSVVASRIAKKTYGTSVVLRFDSSLDPPKLKKVGSDGAEWCRHRFQTLMRKGTRVHFNENVTKDYVPNNVGQTHMKFDLYSTTEQDPRYTEGATVTKEGEFWVTLPEYSMDKRPVIRFTLCFGRSSVEISAKALFMKDQERASETLETRELRVEYIYT